MKPERRSMYLDPIYLILHVDVLLIACYLLLRTEVLTALLKAFDFTPATLRSGQYRFLIWSAVLFGVCALCSYLRQRHFSIEPNRSRGILVFELMVIGAVVLAVWNSLSHAAEIDPYWITRQDFWAYLFDVVTTAGAAYVFADLTSRIRLMFNKSQSGAFLVRSRHTHHQERKS